MSRFLTELVQRRVPQITGFYLAAGWGLLEFTDWSVARFTLPAVIELWVVSLWVVGLPAVVALAWRYGAPGPRRRRPGSGADGSRSVAVLPFENVGGDPDDDFLGTGISGEILAALAKVEGLRVASRTSALAYGGTHEDVRSIGRKLGVESVLEGTVQRSENRLRVRTQLVGVADGYNLWSDRFDREVEDVFSIEDEIAENVTRALRVVLRDRERPSLSRAPPSDIRAYEYYLRGRQFFLQTRLKSLLYAREMFQKAVDIDPTYALAHTGIAEATALIAHYYPEAGADLGIADEASRRALELAPDLPEGHGARGLTLFSLGRLEEAEREFRIAITEDPRLFEARYFYARACFQQGRFEDAARLFGEANSLREDYQAAFFGAQSYEAMGRREEAAAGYALALDVAERHMDLNPDDPRAATMRAVSLCRLGRAEEGLHWGRRALAIDPEDAGVRYNVACLYALEGEVEAAISCLEEAVHLGFGNREWLEKDPDVAALRSDPRFRSLLEGM